MLRNVGKESPLYSAQYPRGAQISSTSRRMPEIRPRIKISCNHSYVWSIANTRHKTLTHTPPDPSQSVSRDRYTGTAYVMYVISESVVDQACELQVAFIVIFQRKHVKQSQHRHKRWIPQILPIIRSLRTFTLSLTFRLSSFMTTDCLHIDKTGRIRVYYSSAFQTVFLVYHCHNTKHVRVPVGIANIKCHLSRHWCAGMFYKPCNQRNGNAVKTSNFVVATFLI